MSPEVPTEKIALQTWWAITWRAIPFAFIASTVMGVLMGLFVKSLGGSPQSLQFPAVLAGSLVGIYINVQVIKRLMTKGFGDYRLIVMRK
ncbi:MAG: hypothetical protein ACRBCK_10730 [Alphaproteobacteria bacterium]